MLALSRRIFTGYVSHQFWPGSLLLSSYATQVFLSIPFQVQVLAQAQFRVQVLVPVLAEAQDALRELTPDILHSYSPKFIFREAETL